MRRKLAIGECECELRCKRKVTEGNHMCFDWAHKPGEGDVHKAKGVAALYKLDEIEAEIAKCHLLFCECHKRQETDPSRITWQSKIAAGL